jgi:hypothetical protein
MSTFSGTEGVPQPDLPLSSFDNVDMDWVIFNNPLDFKSLPEPTTSLIPPSPASCDEIRVTEIDDYFIDDFLLPTVVNPPSMTLELNNNSEAASFPSPPSSDSQSTQASSSPLRPLTPPPPSVSMRRRPGRPSKAEIAARGHENKNLSSRSKHTLRREFHNGSATRSRAKFNGALEELWEVVPEEHRMHALGIDVARQVSRAEKVEIIISYIRKLRTEAEQYE